MRQFSSSEEDETRLRKVLDRCMEGCGRPLKVSFSLFLSFGE